MYYTSNSIGKYAYYYYRRRMHNRDINQINQEEKLTNEDEQMESMYQREY